MAQETVKQITQGGVTRPIEDEIARQKADSAIQGVIVNGTEVAPDSSTKKVSFNIPAPAHVDDQMSDSSEYAVQNKVVKAYVDAVSRRLDELVSTGNVQGVIDTFNEIKAFLNNFDESDTLVAELAKKVDKENGKSLMTDAEHSKLAGLPTGAELTTAMGTKISGITMNGNAVTVSNGVANLGTVLTQHQSLAGRVQSQDVVSIVKISQADYTILPTKDPNTLYIITES